MSDQKKKLVAYHEAGHAILGALMRPWLERELSSPQANSQVVSLWSGSSRNDYDVVAKISIVPRGPAGGVTIFMPSEDRLNSGAGSDCRWL